MFPDFINDVFNNEFFVTADIHSHAYKTHSVINFEGYNSRLINCLKVFNDMGMRAEHIIEDNSNAYGIPFVGLICGDLFNARSNINVITGIKTKQAIEELRDFYDVHCITSIGNHDEPLKSDREYSPELMSPSLTCMVEETMQIENRSGNIVSITTVPYISDREVFMEKLTKSKKHAKGDRKILITHCGIDKAEVGAHGYRLKDEIPLEFLQELGYDFCFCGHYHGFQDLGHGVIIPGSPLQHNFGERDNRTGYIKLDTNMKTYKFIDCLQVPKFVQDRLDEMPENMPDHWVGNYVKVVFTNVDAYMEASHYVQDIIDNGALSFVRELDKGVTKFVDKDSGDITHTMNLETVLKTYVDESLEGDTDEVIAEGLQILEEAFNR